MNLIYLHSKNFIKVISLLIIFTIAACSENNSDQPKSNDIRIDTVYKGTLGDINSSISISKYKDSILIEYHYKYWQDSKRIDVKDQYMDTTGQIRFIYFKYHSDKNKYRVSYSWNDKWGQNILSVDSEFVANKISKLEIILNRTNPIGYDRLEYIIEKRYKHGKQNELVIHDFNLSYNFSEENGKFYKMATDVPIRYVEWESSSKLEFGRVYGNAIDYLFYAVARIDSEYIEIAKLKHNFDVISFIKNNKY